MSCPQCGSSERAAISPGYWECRGQYLIEDHPTVPPHMRRPSYWETCGHRYQEGATASATTPKCACGTYSIGECATCGTPVCGDHGKLTTAGRLCGTCLAEARARRDAARAKEAARQQAVLQAERAAVAEELATTVQAILATRIPANTRVRHVDRHPSTGQAKKPYRKGDDCPIHTGSGCRILKVEKTSRIGGSVRAVIYEARGALVERSQRSEENSMNFTNFTQVTVLTPDGRLATADDYPTPKVSSFTGRLTDTAEVTGSTEQIRETLALLRRAFMA